MQSWGVWSFWIGGSLAIVAGGVLIAWAMLGDWLRQGIGRKATGGPPRRCPKCWYSMKGIQTSTCPECGFTARADSQLYKYRRRWRIALASILFFGIGTFTIRVPSSRGVAWYTYAPTDLILFRLPPSSTDALPLTLELRNRIHSGQLSARQQRRLAEYYMRLYMNPTEPNDRRNAVNLIGYIGHEAAIAAPVLLDALDSSDTSEIAAKALGETRADPERAVPRLIDIIRSDIDLLRTVPDRLFYLRNKMGGAAAIVALGMYADPAAVPVLLEHLSWQDSGRRVPSFLEVITALGRIGPEAMPAITELTAITNDTDEWPERRLAARVSIDVIEGKFPSLADAWAVILVNGIPDDRVIAARSLLAMGTDAAPAQDELMSVLNDPEPEVRAGAISALSELRRDRLRIIEAIRPLVDDPDPSVRTNARMTIKWLDGHW